MAPHQVEKRRSRQRLKYQRRGPFSTASLTAAPGSHTLLSVYGNTGSKDNNNDEEEEEDDDEHDTTKMPAVASSPRQGRDSAWEKRLQWGGHVTLPPCLL